MYEKFQKHIGINDIYIHESYQNTGPFSILRLKNQKLNEDFWHYLISKLNPKYLILISVEELNLIDTSKINYKPQTCVIVYYDFDNSIYDILFQQWYS